MIACCFTSTALCCLVGAGQAPLKAILDTDIGSDVDDCYAVTCAVRHPGLEVVAITTEHDPDLARARLVHRLLKALGQDDIPVYPGYNKPGDPPKYAYAEWGEEDDYIAPEETAPEIIARLASQRPGELALIAIGPQTNIGEALVLDPDLPKQIAKLVAMAGSYKVGYNGAAEPSAEWNVVQDIAAARAVAAAGFEYTLVGLDVCGRIVPTEEQMSRLAAGTSPWCAALSELSSMYRDWGGPYPPILFDVMAVLQAAQPDTCATERVHITVDDQGFTRATDGVPNTTVCVTTDQAAAAATEWTVLGL